MRTLASKLPDVGTTIFTVMSKMAADHGAINLSQGFPDFPVPAGLTALVDKYMREGHNQYPPMTGVAYLREQIAAKIERLYGVATDADEEITVTSGATEALFVAIHAAIHPGEEAIVLDPAYDSYAPAIRLAGGRAIHVPLSAPDFRPDWQRISDAITGKTRLLIVNSPHNPSGSVFTSQDVAALAEVTRGSDVLVVADEVYEHMVYDGASHLSLVSHPELRARAFVISSFGKTYHATGWKVGYAVAPRALTSEFRKIHQFVTFTTHTPTQWAIAEFMARCPEHYLELPRFYQAKRDLFVETMSGSQFDLVPSRGTYFQLADYSRISTMADTDFAAWLTREAGVAAIPVSVFCETPHDARLVRFCFAKGDDTLRRAAELLCDLREIG